MVKTHLPDPDAMMRILSCRPRSRAEGAVAGATAPLIAVMKEILRMKILPKKGTIMGSAQHYLKEAVELGPPLCLAHSQLLSHHHLIARILWAED